MEIRVVFKATTFVPVCPQRNLMQKTYCPSTLYQHESELALNNKHGGQIYICLSPSTKKNRAG